MSKRGKLPKNVHSCDGMVQQLGGSDTAAAIGLWAMAGSWARKHDTGGYVEGRMIKHWRVPRGAVETLVGAGVLNLVRRSDGQWTGDYEFAEWSD